MALGTFTFSRAVGELPLVDVQVAVYAVREAQRLFEVAVCMACGTTDCGVLTEQWILGLRVIKPESAKQFFPTCGRVATFAPLRRKRAFVRIDVTVAAGAKFHVSESRRSIRFVRLVALFACHFDMHTGQRITRLRMIELLRCLPIAYAVTTLAIISQSAFVWVGMAGKAILCQAEERLGQIFVLNQWPQRRRDIFRQVALLAYQSDVFAFERVTRLLVVELVFRRIPVDQRKILAIMFQVAANTILSAGIGHA